MPTRKQKLAASKLLENPSKSISSIMREVGYSPETAKVPSDLTNSKGWEELMELHFPDDKLALKIDEGLEATKPIGALVLIRNDKNGNAEQILKDNEGMIEVPDYAIRHKYVETALKVKRKMPELGDKDNPFKVNVTIDVGETLKKIYGSRNNGSSGKVLNGSV